MFPLQHLSDWSPFRLDALGLVTLLGAEEVNRSVGRLVRSRWLEYLPLLGAYVIAGNRIADTQGSNEWFNITQGYQARAMSPWFARWLLALPKYFRRTGCIVRWSINEGGKFQARQAEAITVSFIACGPLVAIAAMMADWWGLANAIAVILSIFVRAWIVKVHMSLIDNLLQKRYESSHEILNDEISKCWLWTDELKAVVMLGPRQFLGQPSPLVANLEPGWYGLFPLAQAVGWVAFAVHIISIGMSTLLVQIYTIVLLVAPTVLLVWKIGCPDSPVTFWRHQGMYGKPSERDLAADDAVRFYRFTTIATYHIGSCLRADIMEFPQAFHFHWNGHGTYRLKSPSDGDRPWYNITKVQDLLAWLQLSSDEKMTMDKWDMLPHQRDYTQRWMADFAYKEKLIKELVHRHNIELPWTGHIHSSTPGRPELESSSDEHGNLRSTSQDDGHVLEGPISEPDLRRLYFASSSGPPKSRETTEEKTNVL